jgi:hypothetical protein
VAKPTLTQEPGVLNLAWRVGDAVNLEFFVQETDWTGTYLAQIRKTATATTVLGVLTVATSLVNVSVVPPIYAGDTKFTLTMTDVDSRALGSGTFVWDLQDVNGDITRLTGEVTVSKDVTRV